MADNGLLYFAFGSSMHQDSIHGTVKNAERIGLALLEDFEILFNIYSEEDDGGIANVAPSRDGRVFGTLWQIEQPDLIQLDIRQGHPGFYQRSLISVDSEELGNTEAIAYIGKRFNLLGREQYEVSDSYLELLTEGLIETTNHKPVSRIANESDIEFYLHKIEKMARFEGEARELYS